MTLVKDKVRRVIAPEPRFSDKTKVVILFFAYLLFNSIFFSAVFTKEYLAAGVTSAVLAQLCCLHILQLTYKDR